MLHNVNNTAWRNILYLSQYMLLSTHSLKFSRLWSTSQFSSISTVTPAGFVHKSAVISWCVWRAVEDMMCVVYVSITKGGRGCKRRHMDENTPEPVRCCLPTPLTIASGWSPIFPLEVHQPASPSIWTAVQSLRRGLYVFLG